MLGSIDRPRMIARSQEGAQSEAATGPAKGSSESSRAGLKKGPWTAVEDAILVEYVKKYGEGNWNAVQKNCGLMRCGKSCRLRWANHLRPNLKKGSFSPEEERIIIELHARLGNKWARMASQVRILLFNLLNINHTRHAFSFSCIFFFSLG